MKGARCRGAESSGLRQAFGGSVGQRYGEGFEQSRPTIGRGQG